MIPTYNQEAYVGQAIESALSQKYENIEVIVSDDASTDCTHLIAQKYIADPRFKYFKNEKNIGRTANYRKLLYELATGEWVINLDGDDYFNDSYFISHAVSLIKSIPNLKVVAGGIYITKDEKLILTKLIFEDLRILPGKDLLLQWDVSPIGHLAALYHRESALNLDFYRADIISSDWESMLRLILTGNVGCINRPVSTWRLHKKNESQTKKLKPYLLDADYIFVVSKVATTYISDELLKDWRERMLVRHFQHVEATLSEQNKISIIKELLKHGKLDYLKYFPFFGKIIQKYKPKKLLFRFIKSIFHFVGLDIHRYYTQKVDSPSTILPSKQEHWITDLGISKVFDIGANQGQFLGKMLQLFPHLHFYCFEPLLDCFSILKENFKQYPVVSFFNCALGSSNSTQTIYRNAFSLSSSLLPMHENHKEAFPFTKIEFEEQINVKKLDDFMYLINPEDRYLLKIDVQGYEMEVIKGGRDILKNATVILIEVSFKEMYEGQALFHEIYHTISNLGFTFHGHFDQLGHPKNTLPLQADAIFIKKATSSVVLN